MAQMHKSKYLLTQVPLCPYEVNELYNCTSKWVFESPQTSQDVKIIMQQKVCYYTIFIHEYSTCTYILIESSFSVSAVVFNSYEPFVNSTLINSNNFIITSICIFPHNIEV